MSGTPSSGRQPPVEKRKEDYNSHAHSDTSYTPSGHTQREKVTSMLKTRMTDQMKNEKQCFVLRRKCVDEMNILMESILVTSQSPDKRNYTCHLTARSCAVLRHYILFLQQDAQRISKSNWCGAFNA
ncbi:hypothetical protein AVEN_99272-1 [Araneus ventricosus]|uniref:Uncharacterized protein n=1 Tax=Araneus ventricosus TaxID=182803 RepID=A0A4Y2KDZ8_ARAVE|nr:hypothetical protein AVEN_99272-1 [Araneus ventricosus]